MSDAETVATLQSGTYFSVVSWRAPTKNADFELMRRVPLLDGIIEIYTLEDYIYIIVIDAANHNHHQVDEWISPQLMRDQDQPVVFLFLGKIQK